MGIGTTPSSTQSKNYATSSLSGWTTCVRSHFQQDFHSKLMFEMLDELEVEIPEAIITGEMDTIFHRFVHQLGENEIEFADYIKLSGQTEESFLADLRDQASRSVQTDILLDGVAVNAAIEVTDEELAAAYEGVATQVEESADELAARLAGSVQEKRISGDILRRKALDTLVRGAVAIDQDGNTLDLQFDAPTAEAEPPIPERADADPIELETDQNPADQETAELIVPADEAGDPQPENAALEGTHSADGTESTDDSERTD